MQFAKVSAQIADADGSTCIQEAATEGAVVQMGLVGLMLQQGWGCERNPVVSQRNLFAHTDDV